MRVRSHLEVGEARPRGLLGRRRLRLRLGGLRDGRGLEPRGELLERAHLREQRLARLRVLVARAPERGVERLARAVGAHHLERRRRLAGRGGWSGQGRRERERNQAGRGVALERAAQGVRACPP